MKRFLTLVTALGCGWSASIGVGQNPWSANPVNESMEQMFQQWTTETPEERQRLEAIEITPADEKRIGHERLEIVRRDLASRHIALVSEGKDVEYLETLAKSLLPRMRHRDRYRDIEVYVVSVDDTEAGALPGGLLLITRGLLEFAPSEAAMVGVLAHELAHIDHGHQLEDVRRFKLMERTIVGGTTTPQDWATMGMGLAKRFARPFRPEQETQADADATYWMWQAGYDPTQMADLFDRLHERDEKRGAVSAPSFLRSHPYHWQRSQAIRDQAADLTSKRRRTKLYVGRTNLERRIPRSEKSFPE